ncbi:hypothetical protein [Demequina sp.]|uniref:hypothetical protein n=1 Tax=Demequina sp. TaxID=2050685 RepID=UPI003D1205DF
MSREHVTPPTVQDDDHVPMTGDEKLAWAYGIAVVITSGAYFTYLGVQLAQRPASEIAWVVPMLITIGTSIVGVIVGTIAAAIGGAVWQAFRGRFQEPDFTSDERDRDIKRLGDRRSYAAMSVAVVGALALAMLDADTFWIGNFLFLACSVGALVEVVTKIRAYRRGW